MGGWELDALLLVAGACCVALGSLALWNVIGSLRSPSSPFPRWALAGFVSLLALTLAAGWFSGRFVDSHLKGRLALEAGDFSGDLQRLVDHGVLAMHLAGAGVALREENPQANIEEVLTEASVGHEEIVFLGFARRSEEEDASSPRYPLAHAVRSGGAIPLGTDLVADPLLAELFDRALEERQTAISELVPDEAKGRWLVWLVQPVFGAGADPHGAPGGLVAGAIDVQTLVDAALGSRSDVVAVRLAGRVAGGAIRDVVTSPRELSESAESDLEVRADIRVGNDRWLLRVEPGPAFSQAELRLMPLLVVEVGILLSLLVGWVLHDMERRHRALHRLVEARNRQLEDTERSFTTIVDAAPDGVLVVARAEGLVLDANSRMAHLLGYESEALFEKRLVDLLAEQEADDADAVLERVLDEHQQSGRFVHFRHAQGQSVELECSGTPLVFHGRPAIVLMARDVSAVERARRAARAASRAQEQFLSNVSHEIRTPLNGIIGLTSLLKDEHLTGQGRVQVQTLEKCAKDLLTTMTDALDFSRLGSGNVTIKKVPYDPRDLVSRTLRHLAPRAAARDLLLVDSIRSDLPTTLIGDPEILQKVLLILVGNAIKFTHEGEVSLRVWPKLSDEGDSELLVEVHDTGVGISEAMRERIFEPFVQSDGSVTREHGGTGLGLAILSQTLLGIGGTCHLESEEGKGSTFTVTLPAHFPENARPPQHSPELLGRVALVLHPRPSVQGALSETLLSLGVRTLAAPAWRPARDAARRASQQDAPVEILLIDAETLEAGSDDLSSLLDYAAPGTRVVALERHARLERAESADDTLVLPASSHLVERILVKALVLGAPSEPLDKLRERVRGRRVLIVEDNVVNERLLAATLVKEGLKVLTAHNGLEAVERLERESVDLVLMDVQMPVLDGLEATRRIRRVARHRHLPIIALTAQARIEDHEDCLAAGMNDYLAKPTSRDELISTILRWLTEEGRGEGALDAALEKTSTW